MQLYTTPLSLTSQFLFCGLPLRLDSYRGCAFQCTFCYARYRGGSVPEAIVSPADPKSIGRIFDGVFERQRDSMLGQFLRRGTPIHFGGMSDPFQIAENRYGVTRSFLETLAKYHHPTVISTRSVMVSKPPYRELLKEIGPVVVQFSFTSTRARVAGRFEPQSPTPSEILRAMELLTKHGINVTCRWQPYIPHVTESPHQFVGRVARAGARHVAIEHLKLPVETSHPLWRKLVAGSGCDLMEEYRARGAKRDGREFVLPAEEKLPVVLEVREAAHAHDMTVGVADNDLQYFSDTDCCCSGVDQFAGFDNWFRHQAAFAVKRSLGPEIHYGAIAREWVPNGSVERWLNSKSRIGQRTSTIGSLHDHIRHRWNNPSSSASPASFFGVEATDKVTTAGFRIYRWNPDILARRRELGSWLSMQGKVKKV